jgi:hypothetical protein
MVALLTETSVSTTDLSAASSGHGGGQACRALPHVQCIVSCTRRGGSLTGTTTSPPARRCSLDSNTSIREGLIPSNEESDGR